MGKRFVEPSHPSFRRKYKILTTLLSKKANERIARAHHARLDLKFLFGTTNYIRDCLVSLFGKYEQQFN